VASKELPGAEQKLPDQDKFLSALPRPPAGPYAVEKLNLSKLVEKTLRQDALRTTFLVFQAFCIHQILAVWEKMDFFNSHEIYRHPRLLAQATVRGIIVVLGDMGSVRAAVTFAQSVGWIRSRRLRDV
jgi:hypothetical protein